MPHRQKITQGITALGEILIMIFISATELLGYLFAFLGKGIFYD
jgi:hypothetical protein